MIKSGFDFIAPFYDTLTAIVFGKTLRQAQLTFLAQIPAGSNLLLIGGGTGWLLKEVCRQVPTSNIVYLEASAKMLQLSKKKMAGLPQTNIEFRLGTEKSLKPEEKFDFIISPFLLDLFPPAELRILCRNLNEALRVGGCWQVTDFVPPTGNGIWFLAQKELLKSMYVFFRLISKINASELPDWEKSMLEFSLDPQKTVYFYRGMIKSVLYQKVKL